MYQYTMYYSEGTCNRTWETRLQTAWCSRWHLFLPTQATCEIKAGTHTITHHAFKPSWICHSVPICISLLCKMSGRCSHPDCSDSWGDEMTGQNNGMGREIYVCFSGVFRGSLIQMWIFDQNSVIYYLYSRGSQTLKHIYINTQCCFKVCEPLEEYAKC